MSERAAGRPRLCFTMSFDRDYAVGARGAIRSIRRLYGPKEAAIVAFAHEYLRDLVDFCRVHHVELRYSHQIAAWALPLIYRHDEYRNNTTHYFHPECVPPPDMPCYEERSPTGFDHIRHLHPLDVKAYSTGYCLNVARYEWVVHIDADAFLLWRIDDLLGQMPADAVLGFDDGVDALKHLERLYGVAKPPDFDERRYALNAGVVFYRNGEGVRRLMLDFMHYIESPTHYAYSGYFADQGILRALVAKHHLLGRIHYELHDAVSWNPTRERADDLDFVPATGEWINRTNGKRQYVWHGAGQTKTWTGLHHSDSVNRAWRFVGGELVAPTWRDVRGSLTPENCEAMCELIRQHAGTRDRLDILELGTQYGRTAIAMCALLGQHDVEVRVDTCDTFAPSADFPHNHASPADVQRNVEKLGLTAQIRSHHVSSSENLMKRFAGRSFDVVFVDACHEFRQVVADCVVARSLVRPGGLIVGDDWHLEDVRDGCRAVFGASEPRALGQNMWYRQGDAGERAGLADDP